MDELTDKQREWCRLVAAGVSKADAYRKAYGRKEMGAEAASKAAYRLSRNEGVLRYLDELRTRADDSAVLDREERMRMLSRCAVKAEEATRFNEVARLVGELNKMDGAYAPEKVELSGDEVFRRAVLRETGLEPMVRSEG